MFHQTRPDTGGEYWCFVWSHFPRSLFMCTCRFACSPAVPIPCTPPCSTRHQTGHAPCRAVFAHVYPININCHRPIRARRAHRPSLRRVCSPRSLCSRRTTAWAAPARYLNNSRSVLHGRAPCLSRWPTQPPSPSLRRWSPGRLDQRCTRSADVRSMRVGVGCPWWWCMSPYVLCVCVW